MTMASTTTVTHGRSQGDEYGLAAIAEHNASGTEQFPPYAEDAKGLGIYVSTGHQQTLGLPLTTSQHDEYTPAYQEGHSYVQSPPTPSPSDGIRTRSGRTTRRTDSPFSTSKSRMSMSPISKSKKPKKSKLDRSKTPQLTAPLSVLTKDMDVPMKDMDEWVHRPAEVRRQEVEKRNGYVTRPMNSFMLYRSAYAERTKQWCLQNNHQVVSSVSGESWPMEPPEVREQFNEWAKIERANHAAAHPDYKFSPSKATNKRRKDEDSDNDEPDGLDDLDGEYRGSRNVRQRRQQTAEPAFLPSSHGFESTPYYGQQHTAYEQPHYQYVTAPGRPLPSNIAYDHSGQPYNPQTGTYLQPVVSQQPQYQYAVQEALPPRELTPQSLGNYGLPGGQQPQEMFANSRTSTPMQQYNQYGQPIYPQYQTQPQHYQPAYQATEPQMYEHQQYLQAQLQPQQDIDPSLEIMLSDPGANGQGMPMESHFETAIGDMTTGDLGVLEYYDQQTSPDATLAPPWSPTDNLK